MDRAARDRPPVQLQRPPGEGLTAAWRARHSCPPTVSSLWYSRLFDNRPQPLLGFVASAWTTLAAYATMVVVGYFVGKKHYPVPYPVWRVLGIIATAFILGYLASEYNKIAPVISYVSILAFILFVWILESKKNKKLI